MTTPQESVGVSPRVTRDRRSSIEGRPSAAAHPPPPRSENGVVSSGPSTFITPSLDFDGLQPPEQPETILPPIASPRKTPRVHHMIPKRPLDEGDTYHRRRYWEMPNTGKKMDTPRYTGSGLYQKHFDVIMAGHDNCEKLDDYLRFYYTDFLDAPPAQSPLEASATEVDVKKLADWIGHVHPRTRMDAYPLLMVAKDVLGRIMEGSLMFINKDMERLEREAEEREAAYQEEFAGHAAARADIAELKAIVERQEEEVLNLNETIRVDKKTQESTRRLLREEGEAKRKLLEQEYSGQITQLQNQTHELQSQIDAMHKEKSVFMAQHQENMDKLALLQAEEARRNKQLIGSLGGGDAGEMSPEELLAATQQARDAWLALDANAREMLLKLIVSEQPALFNKLDPHVYVENLDQETHSLFTSAHLERLYRGAPSRADALASVHTNAMVCGPTGGSRRASGDKGGDYGGGPRGPSSTAGRTGPSLPSWMPAPGVLGPGGGAGALPGGAAAAAGHGGVAGGLGGAGVPGAVGAGGVAGVAVGPDGVPVPLWTAVPGGGVAGPDGIVVPGAVLGPDGVVVDADGTVLGTTTATPVGGSVHLPGGAVLVPGAPGGGALGSARLGPGLAGIVGPDGVIALAAAAAATHMTGQEYMSAMLEDYVRAGNDEAVLMKVLIKTVQEEKRWDSAKQMVADDLAAGKTLWEVLNKVTGFEEAQTLELLGAERIHEKTGSESGKKKKKHKKKGPSSRSSVTSADTERSVSVDPTPAPKSAASPTPSLAREAGEEAAVSAAEMRAVKARAEADAADKDAILAELQASLAASQIIAQDAQTALADAQVELDSLRAAVAEAEERARLVEETPAEPTPEAMAAAVANAVASSKAQVAEISVQTDPLPDGSEASESGGAVGGGGASSPGKKKTRQPGGSADIGEEHEVGEIAPGDKEGGVAGAAGEGGKKKIKKKASGLPEEDEIDPIFRMASVPAAFKFMRTKPKQPVKPMPVKQILSTISSLYQEKIIADEADDRTNHPRQNLPDFSRDFLIMQYGLRSLAMRNMRALLSGVASKKDTLPRLAVYGYLSGLTAGPEWSEGACDFILYILQKAFPKNQVKERMEAADNLIRIEIAIDATLAGFQSPYASNSPDMLIDKLEAMAQQSPTADTLLVDAWMEVLVMHWRDGAVKRLDALFSLFSDFDFNKDSTLDFQEFKQMIKSVAHDLPERQILQVYLAAVGKSHDKLNQEEDSIDAKTFARVMISNRLCPPFIDFNKRVRPKALVARSSRSGSRDDPPSEPPA